MMNTQNKQKVIILSTTGVDGIISAYAMQDVFSVLKTVFVNPYDSKDVAIKTKDIENSLYPIIFLGFSMRDMSIYKNKCFSILFSSQSTPSIQQITPSFCSITVNAQTCAESILRIFGSQLLDKNKALLQGCMTYHTWLRTRNTNDASYDKNLIFKYITYETLYELLKEKFFDFLKKKSQEQFNHEINTFQYMSHNMPHTLWQSHLLRQIKIASALRQKKTLFTNFAGSVKRFPQGKNNRMTPLGALLYFKGFPQQEFPELNQETHGFLYDRKHKHVWIHTPYITDKSNSMLEYFFRPLKISFSPSCGFPLCDIVRGTLPSPLSLEKVHAKIDTILSTSIQKERETTSSELSGMDLGV